MNKFIYVLLIMCLCLMPNNALSVHAQQSSPIINIIRADIDAYLAGGGVNRVAYSTGELKSANYLASKMLECGLEFYTGDSFIQSFGSGHKTSQNVVGIKRTNVSDDIVVLGAHYDSHKDSLNAVYDNASGVVIVLSLMNALQQISLPYNIVFVFYGAEEVGMQGSAHFVNSMSALTARNILLAMNFDSVGVGEYTYFYAGDTLNSHKKIFESNDWNVISYPAYPRANYFSGNVVFGYNHIGLQSDNFTYINNSIRSVTFFSGNATDVTLGFKESIYNDNLHHTKNDNLSYILEKYPNFLSNINNVANLTLETLTDSNFYTQITNLGNDINLNFFNDKLIIVCVGLVGLLFVNKFLTRKLDKHND